MCIIYEMSRKGKCDRPVAKSKRERKIDIHLAIKYYFINQLSKSEIARIFNVNPSAITLALKPFEMIFKNKEFIEYYQKKTTNILKAVEAVFLNYSLKDDKLKKASVNNLMYAFTQAHMARLREEGKPTEILDFSNLTQAKDRLQAIEEKLKYVVPVSVENSTTSEVNP